MPEQDTVERFGARVTIVDPVALLAAARTEPVVLRLGTDFPPPVTGVRVTLRPDTADRTLRMVAEIRTGAVDRATDTALGWLALNALSPAGALLVRRLAGTGVDAGPLAARVGRMATEASRRLGLDGPPPTAVVDRPPVADPAGAAVLAEAEALGLRPEVVDAPAVVGRTVTVRVEMPVDAVTPAHLRATVAVALQVVRDLAGDDPEPRVLRGRAYVLDRPPAAPQPARPAAPRSETVTLDQVGGLDEVVARFREIAISFRHPDVMARWGARRPQGILLYGPPGTGKTMLARALANEIGADFKEIRTPEILDKWLGGSERNIKQIFREARRYREPTVLLFDEFDSIISYAGAGGDAASQAVNAVAGIFKQEMNTLIEENPNVIVVATTNFPQRVDASLVRSGRFDVKLSIPPPDEAGRAEIIAKMIRELVDRHAAPGFRMFADDVDPAALAALASGLTGADIREVLRRVQLAKAMREATAGTPAAPITQEDLTEAVTTLRRG
ncbi:ATP-binding protein [Micromonospora endolithica]|uniref:ATP-binding protein n=1 Tax=Micromonospora endolithica TaxID=230091 RepID=A0A3A9ZT10_9ACTN|nr:ATP-binding protein [Micromonospora endolithica]RKN51369.1 ATP-binding protein [Micromonospora endolithica]TWJ22362.1 transitional endoplasmic reticulum ATPase [Micromonospora endolithica]